MAETPPRVQPGVAVCQPSLFPRGLTGADIPTTVSVKNVDEKEYAATGGNLNARLVLLPASNA